MILNFTLGEDLRNERLLETIDPLYRLGNRINMLGDIFHSAPQDIGPPSSEADCGLNTRRCVSTLFAGKTGAATDYQQLETPAQVIDPTSGTMVANPGTIDAYEAYYRHQTFGLKLPRATLFGANDGMVHAVQTACFVNPVTVSGTTYPSYYEGPNHTGCVTGSVDNGAELWAFIPPDLLPKLALVLLGKHQYFVDSSPMVRDIYAPSNTPIDPVKRYTVGTPTQMDFKRVAIIGEREGGTHWISLDVTDPTTPRFLWIFPQPNTVEELSVGYSWGDWTPNAPPIVPVRVAAPIPTTGFPEYTDSSASPTPFLEKWVVLLPGGYDPYGISGKGLYMLDAYQGDVVAKWGTNGTVRFDFSVAALPAIVAWGTQLTETNPTYNNGFSDTAIVGDMGGQIWTLRFNDVGAGSPVTNWFAGRSFRQYKAEDPNSVGVYAMKHRTPIFQMASVARMPTGPMRTFVGTGDRANMAEKNVGDCSIYNPLACGKRQCIMTMATNTGLGPTAGPSGVSSYQGNSAVYYTSTSSAGSLNANECSPAYTEANACADCSGLAGGTKGATITSPGEPQYACTNTATGWKCSLRTISDFDSERLEVIGGTPAPNPATDVGYFSRFIAVNPFTAGGNRIPFTTLAMAQNYDNAALTETGLTNLFSSSPFTFPANAAPSVADTVTGDAAGYYFYYPVVEERTATNSVLMQSCVSWYSMVPAAECVVNADCATNNCNTTTHTCVDAIVCNANNLAMPSRTAYLYQVNAVTGSSTCGVTSTSGIRLKAPVNSFVLPPPPAQVLVSINAAGQVQYGLITTAGQTNAPAASASGSTVPFNFLHTIETPRELHECRHNNNPAACYQ